MARIAEHHKIKNPNYWKADDNKYQLVCDWPDSVYVQWGGNGVVLGKECYDTAFFEAFPDKSEDAGGFIRGEGKTIEEAEKSCYDKYIKQRGCAGKHAWARKGYTNGGTICRKCGAFQSKVFKPIVKLGECKKPVDKFSATFMLSRLEEKENSYNSEFGTIIDGIPQKDHYSRKMYLRYKHFGILENKKTTKG